jgi:hypothetical protein
VTDLNALRAEFVRLLTEDGSTTDRRRKEYNQAIFDADQGWPMLAVWTRIDLDMILEKFDRAAHNIQQRNIKQLDRRR